MKCMRGGPSQKQYGTNVPYAEDYERTCPQAVTPAKAAPLGAYRLTSLPNSLVDSSGLRWRWKLRRLPAPATAVGIEEFCFQRWRCRSQSPVPQSRRWKAEKSPYHCDRIARLHSTTRKSPAPDCCRCRYRPSKRSAGSARHGRPAIEKLHSPRAQDVQGTLSR